MGKVWHKIDEVRKLQRLYFRDSLNPESIFEYKRLVNVNDFPKGVKVGNSLVISQGMFVIGKTPDTMPNWGIRITHLEAAPLMTNILPCIQIGLNMGYDPSPDFPDDKKTKYKMRHSVWAEMTGDPNHPLGTNGPVYENNPLIEYELNSTTYYKSWQEYGSGMDTGAQMNLDVINPIFPMQIGVREEPRAMIGVQPVPVTVIVGCGSKPLMPPVIGPFTNYQTPAQVANNFRLIAIIYNENTSNDDMFLTVDYTAYANNPGGYGFYVTDADVTASATYTGP
jgi:hypothetical protein